MFIWYTKSVIVWFAVLAALTYIGGEAFLNMYAGKKGVSYDDVIGKFKAYKVRCSFRVAVSAFVPFVRVCVFTGIVYALGKKK